MFCWYVGFCVCVCVFVFFSLFVSVERYKLTHRNHGHIPVIVTIKTARKIVLFNTIGQQMFWIQAWKSFFVLLHTHTLTKSETDWQKKNRWNLYIFDVVRGLKFNLTQAFNASWINGFFFSINSYTYKKKRQLSA